MNLTDFVFDGEQLWPEDHEDYGIMIDASEVYRTPEKDYELVEVPGMNGSLVFDRNRFKNVIIPVKCLIKSDFDTYFNKLMNFLLSRNGYCDLVLPTDSGHFRKAVFRRAVKSETWQIADSGQFTLEFECKPQRYLNSGTVPSTYSSGATITNPYMFDAKPLIRWYGDGTLVMQSQDANYAIEVEGIEDTDYIDIDCETMTCTGAHNLNMSQYVTVHDHEYPVLKANKTTTITYSSTHALARPLTITPRWWEL